MRCKHPSCHRKKKEVQKQTKKKKLFSNPKISPHSIDTTSTLTNNRMDITFIETEREHRRTQTKRRHSAAFLHTKQSRRAKKPKSYVVAFEGLVELEPLIPNQTRGDR
jgi:hypothetical protein